MLWTSLKMRNKTSFNWRDDERLFPIAPARLELSPTQIAPEAPCRVCEQNYSAMYKPTASRIVLDDYAITELGWKSTAKANGRI